MEKQELKPLNPQDFRKKIKTTKSQEKVDFEVFFQQQIINSSNFAVGPFYWFIPDNSGPNTVAASASFELLTPHSVTELLDKSTDPIFFSNNILEEDREYVLAAIEIAMKTSEEYHAAQKAIPKFNIYCRMPNKYWKFVWRLIQFPAIYFNEIGQAEGVFVMVTDLSHLPYINKPMMTIIDNDNKVNQYFSVSVETKLLNPINLPKITKREQELIKLIIKGYNNPLIAKQLEISIHTVQNHKRNLREKTNTKTSAELIAFVIAHNLL
jgi:DNA-binding CsgD family transcriptional regulator